MIQAFGSIACLSFSSHTPTASHTAVRVEHLTSMKLILSFALVIFAFAVGFKLNYLNIRKI